MRVASGAYLRPSGCGGRLEICARRGSLLNNISDVRAEARGMTGEIEAENQ